MTERLHFHFHCLKVFTNLNNKASCSWNQIVLTLFKKKIHDVLCFVLCSIVSFIHVLPGDSMGPCLFVL